MKLINKQKQKLRKITLQELGLYAKVINLDYKPKSNKELANLISSNFNVLCTEKDLEDYERLHIHNQQLEDYALESRIQEYNLHNP
jgi:hypothetical protein